MRRVLMLTVMMVAAVALVGAALVPAGAGDDGDQTMIVVRKTVQGPATGGFTVFVSCESNEPEEATLNFDATGAPTTFTGQGDGLDVWDKVDGAWKASFGVGNPGIACTASETDADGAPTTSWTCDFVLKLVNGDTPDAGCDAPSDTGTGPVGFSLTASEVEMQVATVHFTNTIPEPEPAAEAVEAAPTFTG